MKISSISKVANLSHLEAACKNFSVLAVVGKMAAGKNFISSFLESKGWKSIDADLLVHKAIEQAATKIYEEFKIPAEKQNLILLNSDGSINRRELGKLLFSNPSLLAKQEAIVYPIITKMVEAFIAENPKAIINATVLYKTPELLNFCDAIVYVKANFIKRFIRARKRDGLSYKQIFKRFFNQKNLLSKYKFFDKQIILIKN